MFPFLAFPLIPLKLSLQKAHENSFQLHGDPILYCKELFPLLHSNSLKKHYWIAIYSFHNLHTQALNLYIFTPKMWTLHFNKTWNVNVNKYCLLIISNRSFTACNYFVNNKGSAANYLWDSGQVITLVSYFTLLYTSVILNSKYFN